MPKVRRQRTNKNKKSPRRRRYTRKLYRKHGGGLADELVAKSAIVNQFIDTMAGQEHYVAVHNYFPRKNAGGKYVVIFKDAELEDDSLPQKLLVIKMDKQGDEFVNVSVEDLNEGIPQTYIDEYPIQLSALNEDTTSIHTALGSVFLGL